MRLVVIYASDLAAESEVAPGGITNNLRGYLAQLPADWEIEVWGAQTGAEGIGRVRELELPRGRAVRFRPIVQAEPLRSRQRPLSPAFCKALALSAWRYGLRRGRWDAMITHRTEYHAALGLSQPPRALPPSVAMIHGSSAWSYTAMGRARGFLQRAGERLALQFASAIALVAGSTLPYYRSEYPRLANRFRWIPNGVDIRRFNLAIDAGCWRLRHGIPLDARVLVYHGRYEREKGIGRMIDTLAVLRAADPSWHLVCAGSGSDASMLRDAATGEHRGHVHDLGFVAPTELPAVLGSADVALLVSEYEGLSNALLESLAAGLPVVGTAVGDTPLVLGHVAAELIGAADPRAIAERVSWAYARRVELAPVARRTATHFSLEARASRLRALFEGVAGGLLPPEIV